MAGLWTWLAADKLTGLSDGNPVPTWPNAVPGSGSDAIGISSPTYKTGILNGLPIVRFGGTNYFRLLSLALASPGFSMFIVFKMAAITNAYSGVFGFGAGADQGGYFIKSNGTSATCPGTSTSYDGTGAASFGTANWNYVSLIFGPTTYDTRRNGAADKTGTAFAWSGIGYVAWLANQAVGSRVMSGDIAEVLIYGRALTSSGITAVESYLATKYAL